MLTERSIRRALNKKGYALHKSRKLLGIDNFGGYMIIDISGNFVVAGSRFELSLENVSEWMNA